MKDLFPLSRNRLIAAVFFVAFFAIIVVFSYPVNSNDVSSPHSKAQVSPEQKNSLEDVFATFDSAAESQFFTPLQRAHKVGQLQLQDIEKLSFVLPGDKSFGENPKFEFFNPMGEFKGIAIAQSLIDKMTVEPGAKIIFNLRRSIHSYGVKSFPYGSTVEVLYLIVPRVIAKGCKSGEVIFKGKLETGGVDFLLAQDNHTIVDDGLSITQCVLLKSTNEMYYFYPIFQRVKYPGRNTWRAY